MKLVSWQQLQGKSFIGSTVLAAVLLVAGNPKHLPAPPDIGDRVLVADFVNDTQNPLLGQRLGQVLKLSLEQSTDLLLYPEVEIQDSLRQMVLNPFAPVTADVARSMCMREKIPGFLLPRVVRLSGSYVASVRLAAVKNGNLEESPADMVRAKDEAELALAVEDMGRHLRRLFGEDARSLAATRKPLFSPGARVAPVLQLFTEAMTFHSRSDYAREVPRLEEAVTLEPDFALAHSRLASLYWHLGWTVPALEHASRAKENAGKLPPKEECGVLGTYHLLSGDYQRAIQQFQALAALYPRSWEAHLALGDAALYSGDARKAIAEYQEACRLNQWQPEPQLRLCLPQLSDRRTDRARKAWEKALSLAPESPDVVCAGGLVDLAENDLGGAIRAFQQASAHPAPLRKSTANYFLGQAEIYGGRLQSALATLQDGIEEDRRQGYTYYEADKRLARAEIFLLQGDTASAVSECRLVPPLQGDVVRTACLGGIFARSGQLADAAGIATQIEKNAFSPLSKAHAEILRGEIALASGRSDEAIHAFRLVHRLRPAPAAQEPLARALAQAGLWAQAEVEYRALSDRKAEILFPCDRTWFMGTWSQVLFGHATSLSKLGRNEEARQQFRSYLWVLDGADGNISSLQGARTFLRKRI